jgi:uncharacterized protein YjbI with pentapeptide repeats
MQQPQLTTFISVVVTVAVLNLLAEQREERRRIKDLQEQLVRDAGSTSNEAAKRAIDELRKRGWLEGENSLLRKANLRHANLQGANLERANLQGASLDWANLQGASLDYANLRGASLVSVELQGASLFDARLQGGDCLERSCKGRTYSRRTCKG